MNGAGPILLLAAFGLSVWAIYFFWIRKELAKDRARSGVAEKPDWFCVVCGKTLPPHTNECCTPTSLVATKERGIFQQTRAYYNIQGKRLTESDMAALKQKEQEKHKQLQAEATAMRAAEAKRAAESIRQRQFEELTTLSVFSLERLLRKTKKQRRSSAFLGGATTEDDIFDLQDAELRRAAITILGDNQTNDAVTALRNLKADQEDPPRIYSPNRGMKCDELEMIRSILERRRDRNAVVIKCRKCKAELDVTPATAGTQVTCNNCQHRMLAPCDPTPTAWAKRLVDTKDWDGLLEPFSHTKLEETDLDPWYHDKQKQAELALVGAGKQAIPSIVELIIRNNGWCLGLAELCDVLVTIADPVAGPYLKVISANYSSLHAIGSIYDRVQRFTAKHGSASCDHSLLTRLTAAYQKAPKPIIDAATTKMNAEWKCAGCGELNADDLDICMNCREGRYS